MKKFVNTRIGISKFSIQIDVKEKQALEIIQDMKKLKLSNSNFKMVSINGNFTYIRYTGKNLKITLDIDYHDGDVDESTSEQNYEIDVYITPVSPSALLFDGNMDIDFIIDEYNKNIKSLSKSIPAFSEYTINAIGRSIVFDLNELGYEPVTYELLDLVKRGVYSSDYSNIKYVPCPENRLESNEMAIQIGTCEIFVSVSHIRDCCKNKAIPVNNTGQNSTNIIKFSVSLETDNEAYSIMQMLTKSRNHSFDELQKNGHLMVMKHIFSDKKRIKSILREYLGFTIYRGNYYKFPLAVEAVQNSDFNQEKKHEMITALKLISEIGYVHRAEQHIVKSQMVFPGFYDALKYLANIGINPLTLDDKLEISMIPGLLESCESLVYDINLPVVGKGK
jgi:hypothetical protein